MEKYQSLIQTINDGFFRAALLISLVSFLKLFITLYFQLKIQQSKISKITINEKSKSASFEKADEDRVVHIFKNLKNEDDVA